MDIRSFFSPSSKKKVYNEDDDVISVSRKKTIKRKGVLYDSDSSDENPLPKTVRKRLNSSNVIANSGDESKKISSKIKRKKTSTDESSTKKLKETTPNDFFGSFKSNKSSKTVEKRKVNENASPAKSKKLKQKSDESFAIDNDNDENNFQSSLKTTNKSSTLSGKLAHAASKHNGQSSFSAKAPSSCQSLPQKGTSSDALTPFGDFKKSETKSQNFIKQEKTKTKTPSKIKPDVQVDKPKTATPQKNNLNNQDVKIEKSKTKTPSKKDLKTKEIKREKSGKTTTPNKLPSINTNSPENNNKAKTNTPKQEKDADSKLTSSDNANSDKQARFLKFQKWQNRAGPSAPGSKEVPQGQDFCFEGMIFVITGVQESLDRDEIQSLVERYGGKVTGSVSSRTSYLIAGAEPGESKIKKAQQHSTKIIDEDEFLNLIRTLPGKKSKYEVGAKLTKTKSKKGSTPKESASQQQDISKPELSSTPVSIEESSLMWVDKYKPKTIKQIIGQQGANSNVQKLLNWLKKWNFNNRTPEGKAKPKPKVTPWGGGDPTGASFKAALLSGPPGVGKTTSATLVCQELGLPYVELNASDRRSKRILQEDVVASVQNTSLSNLFAAQGSKFSKLGSEHVLIMDEVDGMAGNEDRGGVQELIQIIKATKIPIICMCNDRSSPKIRSLVNHCFDLRFQRPRVEQITSSVMSICFKEGFDVQAPAVQAVIRGCNQDVRQVLHNLNMLKASDSALTYDAAKSHAGQSHKDVNLGVFEIARKLLSSESASLSLLDKSDLFFMDYSIVPKFIQENYINVSPFQAKGSTSKHLELLSKAADCIASGDLIEASMRHDQSWSMLPTLGLLSTVLPCDYMRGSMKGMINFPSFFGKLSTTGKNHRLLQELKFHSSIGTNGCTEQIMNLDLVSYFRWHLTQPLLRQSRSGENEVAKVTKLLGDYDWTREDFDSLIEVGQFSGKPNYMSQVDSKVKASFTRTYNKETHLTPYAVESAAAKKKKKKTVTGIDDENPDETQNESDQSDAEDMGVDGMIKKSKKASSQNSKSRSKKSKSATAGTSRKRK